MECVNCSQTILKGVAQSESKLWSFTFLNQNRLDELILQAWNITVKQDFSICGHMLVLTLRNVLPVIMQKVFVIYQRYW